MDLASFIAMAGVALVAFPKILRRIMPSSESEDHAACELPFCAWLQVVPALRKHGIRCEEGEDYENLAAYEPGTLFFHRAQFACTTQTCGGPMVAFLEVVASSTPGINKTERSFEHCELCGHVNQRYDAERRGRFGAMAERGMGIGDVVRHFTLQTPLTVEQRTHYEDLRRVLEDRLAFVSIVLQRDDLCRRSHVSLDEGSLGGHPYTGQGGADGE